VEPWMWSGARRLTEHDQEKKDEKRKKIRWARVTRAVARRRTMGDAIPRGINSVFHQHTNKSYPLLNFYEVIKRAPHHKT
jgi:hypothetical protein